MEAVLTRGIEDAPAMRTNSNTDTPGSLSQPHLDGIQLDESWQNCWSPWNAAEPQQVQEELRDALGEPPEPRQALTRIARVA